MKSIFAALVLALPLARPACAQIVLGGEASSIPTQQQTTPPAVGPLPNMEPRVVERATASTAVEVAHKSVGQNLAQYLHAHDRAKSASIMISAVLALFFAGFLMQALKK